MTRVNFNKDNRTRVYGIINWYCLAWGVETEPDDRAAPTKESMFLILLNFMLVAIWCVMTLKLGSGRLLWAYQFIGTPQTYQSTKKLSQNIYRKARTYGNL